MMCEPLVKTLPPDGWIEYLPNWLEPALADRLMARLEPEIAWERRSITMFGRTLLQPRLICFMGEAGVVYRYSGGRYAAAPWHPLLQPMLDPLRRVCPPGFNCVLVNLYRDGLDSMGWHADDEPELGPRPTIASLSLGATRRFQLRSRENHQRRFELPLEHGSLLVMRGQLQAHWQHQVPKTSSPVEPRINLTFRWIPSAPDPVAAPPIG